ncbi:MAG: N-methylhydantoinase B/oxoprolinase/acetone carboxylase alpha subunit, partial [Candidatus Marinamargulisbacteria bacterium]
VAEQMGESLRKTAMSTNVRERLDYSCAVFDGMGNLIANAPHIPVHLGAMSETVKMTLKSFPNLLPGDVVVTNNPFKGGSHLPDITVVTPVFNRDGELTFLTASRAHHADIGGIVPGSMPAHTTCLEDEGVLIDMVKIVDEGEFNERLFASLFLNSKYPARMPKTNKSDLVAQIASNQTGARQLLILGGQYGFETVRAYMTFVKDNASFQVRQAFSALKGKVYRFSDQMDDGTPIKVRISVEDERVVFDFEGTGAQSKGNLNAPPAITYAAVLYVVRAMVGEQIPLNTGCLDSIDIRLPENSLLNPKEGCAVAGGNVETSQRVIDVLLGALELAAASQGTMNNVTFGNKHFGYYETIGGGVGARPNYNGVDGVHTHMTNTRITDAEILESRYPIHLMSFAIRPNSGGKGRWRGGCGIVRIYKFLERLDVSIISQRRTTPPFGMAGGGDGAMGENIRHFASGGSQTLLGVDHYTANDGDILEIRTPGGGAWGD